MDTITIVDLEVRFRVGVTEEERTQPQRLLITVEMFHDFKSAAASDNLAETVDYYAVTQRLLQFGDACHWSLIETLATDIAEMLIADFRVRKVTVGVKKFIIPQARHVAVKVTRPG